MLGRQFTGAALLCLATTAAHADVTLYGMVDTFVDYVDAGHGYSAAMGSSGQWASRIGLRGNEDLGGGYAATFDLENGINTNSGAAVDPTAAFNRQAWVGLAGPFGEVRLGRQNSPLFIYEGRSDAFGAVTQASGINNLSTYTIRTSNTVSYISPFIMGFRASVYVGLGTAGGYRSPGSSVEYALMYDNGPFSAGYDGQAYYNTAGMPSRRSSFGSISYKIAPVTVFGGFSTANWEDEGINTRTYSLSARYDLNAASSFDLGGAYMQDRTLKNSDAFQLSALYVYNFSRATNVYAAISFLRNDGIATQTLNGAATAGPTPLPGADVRGVQLGIVHMF
ncbi:porin [Pararobbsia silviterrae]|uniref:Porin n=1 Tax=Pararobbsia silviterrae TaxID=1792498 RepID=A0A494Y3N3_9BURK|nr:porin [Pararobbsia silviterrae]RKP56628.1 porin [Pararobbsia silviterrae]